MSCQSTWRGAAVVTCAFAATAHAGPPYQTDDPEPVALHKYEVNVAARATLTRSGRSGAFPGVEINYGGAPDVQLHLGVPLAFDRGTQPGTRYGIGDAELGVKYRWVQETATTPMVAIYPTYALPTGSAARELGNGRPQVFLPVWLQKSFGPWTVDAGGGYWINHAPDARDNWYAGWLVQRKINERLVLGGELYHRSAQTVGERGSTAFNLGRRTAWMSTTICSFPWARG